MTSRYHRVFEIEARQAGFVEWSGLIAADTRQDAIKRARKLSRAETYISRMNGPTVYCIVKETP